MRGEMLNRPQCDLVNFTATKPINHTAAQRWDRRNLKPCRPLWVLATFAGYRPFAPRIATFARSAWPRCTTTCRGTGREPPSISRDGSCGRNAGSRHTSPQGTSGTTLWSRPLMWARRRQAVGGVPTPLLSPEEGRLFSGLRDDMQKAARDLENKAAVVEDAGMARADRQLWLSETGFALHLRSISVSEIESSYKLPLVASGRGVKRREPATLRLSSRRPTASCDNHNNKN